jgi:hypothetical protein
MVGHSYPSLAKLQNNDVKVTVRLKSDRRPANMVANVWLSPFLYVSNKAHHPSEAGKNGLRHALGYSRATYEIGG